jgi:sulfur carrier protein ThiS
LHLPLKGGSLKLMKVYVNNIPHNILPGMTVKHLLISAGLLKETEQGKRIADEWGNEIGLAGELTEGDRIFVVSQEEEDR